MATINWSLQHKRDTAANWTANNPTLLAGQIGIETDNLTTTPKFKIGDGSTAWNTLPYANGTGIFQPLATNLTSLSGLTYASTSFVKMTAAGTFALDTTTYLTTISGLNISLLNNDSGYITSSALSPYLTVSGAALTYQPLDADLTSWAGVTRASGFDTFATTPSSANLSSLLTDKTGTGVNVFGTSPTFTTDITTPRINGVSSNLYVSTALQVQTGSMSNSGIVLREVVGSATESAIYLGVTPISTNYFIKNDGSGTSYLNYPSGGALIFQDNGTTTLGSVSNARWDFQPQAQTSGSTNAIRVLCPSSSGLTASSNVHDINFRLAINKQFATGNHSAMHFVNFSKPGLRYVGASTATVASTVNIAGAVDALSNAAITESVGLLVSSSSVNTTGTVTTSYGGYFNAMTGATANYSAGFNGSVIMVSGRILGKQGADVASANNLVLGSDGNVFEITGTTQVNLISNLGWQNGSQITLLFTSTPTVKHNQATSTTNITIQLAGAADFVATAGDTLTLVLSEIGGTQAWREVSRAVI